MTSDTNSSPALPHEWVAQILGVEDKEQSDLLRDLIDTLAKISPDLVPTLEEHPLARAIARGPGAYADLLTDFKTHESEVSRVAILDAIREILDRSYPTAELIEGLELILEAATSPAIASLAARALATAKVVPFLELQKNLLASESLQEVRAAARLLGYGQYKPAVKGLLLFATPERMATLDVVVWALGEIGAQEALPDLHTLLSRFIMTDAVIEAIGKIGGVTSVVRLLPVLSEGSDAQREKAALAMSRIARKQYGRFDDADLQKMTMSALERTIDTDASLIARYHAIVAYAVLGGTLGALRIRKALGAKLNDNQIGALAAFARPKFPKS